MEVREGVAALRTLLSHELGDSSPSPAAPFPFTWPFPFVAPVGRGYPPGTPRTSVLPVEDHWGHEYHYERNDPDVLYTVESYGKDGIDGDDISLADRFAFDKDIVLANGQFVASPE